MVKDAETQNHSDDLQEQDADFIDSFQQAIIDNQEEIEFYDAKYGSTASLDERDITWHTVGAVTAYTRTDRGMILDCENGFLELVWFSPATLRVRLNSDDDFSDYFSYAAVNLDSNIDLFIRETDTQILVDTGVYLFRIMRDSAIITCTTLDSDAITTITDHQWRDDGAIQLKTVLTRHEASFGTGERAFDLNLRGRKLTLWNTDPGGFSRGDDPIDYCVPFYLGVHHNGAYGILWDNSVRSTIDIGATATDELIFTGEAGSLCYYVFAGNDVADVMKSYTAISGRMPLPPLWTLGYHQCRYSYMNTEQVLSTAQKLRDRNIPCDAIYLDIHYMDEYRIFTWDTDAFPDMTGMIDTLHEMGMKLVTIMDPGVKVEEGYSGHDTGIDQHVFITYPDGKPAAGVVWPGLCYFPDFTDPDARTWWADQLDDLLSCGVDGIWNDMNEPLMFSPEGPADVPDYVQHDAEGRGSAHLHMHNVYGMQMGRASMTALERHRPGKRQFTIVRAGGAGAQRYSASWTGDNYSTWDDLRLSLSMILQMGLSGISFTGADIGGFNDEPTGELLTRWTQAGSLLPLFRNHSAVNAPRQEPWQFGQPYEDYIREAIELRYRLLPYLYTAFAQCHFDGTPIVRPLFTAEPHNPELRSIDDCYLVGDKILVAPIMQPATIRRTVYLPEGDWYNFHTQERITGERLITVNAPLDTLPLFVKSGTVLPMWTTMQHTDERPLEKLILRIYADMGETVLYEDAGEGIAYQEGEYRWTSFVCHETADTLTIERHFEGNYKPAYDTVQLQVVGASKAIEKVMVDGVGLSDLEHVNGVLRIDIPASFTNVTLAI